jgi:hypothetical protein
VLCADTLEEGALVRVPHAKRAFFFERFFLVSVIVFSEAEGLAFERARTRQMQLHRHSYHRTTVVTNAYVSMHMSTDTSSVYIYNYKWIHMMDDDCR